MRRALVDTSSDTAMHSSPAADAHFNFLDGVRYLDNIAQSSIVELISVYGKHSRNIAQVCRSINTIIGHCFPNEVAAGLIASDEVFAAFLKSTLPALTEALLRRKCPREHEGVVSSALINVSSFLALPAVQCVQELCELRNMLLLGLLPQQFKFIDMTQLRQAQAHHPALHGQPLGAYLPASGFFGEHGRPNVAHFGSEKSQLFWEDKWQQLLGGRCAVGHVVEWLIDNPFQRQGSERYATTGSASGAESGGERLDLDKEFSESSEVAPSSWDVSSSVWVVGRVCSYDAQHDMYSIKLIIPFKEGAGQGYYSGDKSGEVDGGTGGGVSATNRDLLLVEGSTVQVPLSDTTHHWVDSEFRGRLPQLLTTPAPRASVYCTGPDGAPLRLAHSAEADLGRFVRVWWSRYRRYFYGRIVGFSESAVSTSAAASTSVSADCGAKLHSVCYEDGDVRQYDMESKDYELMAPPAEVLARLLSQQAHDDGDCDGGSRGDSESPFQGAGAAGLGSGDGTKALSDAEAAKLVARWHQGVLAAELDDGSEGEGKRPFVPRPAATAACNLSAFQLGVINKFFSAGGAQAIFQALVGSSSNSSSKGSLTFSEVQGGEQSACIYPDTALSTASSSSVLPLTFVPVEQTLSAPPGCRVLLLDALLVYHLRTLVSPAQFWKLAWELKEGVPAALLRFGEEQTKRLQIKDFNDLLLVLRDIASVPAASSGDSSSVGSGKGGKDGGSGDKTATVGAPPKASGILQSSLEMLRLSVAARLLVCSQLQKRYFGLAMIKSVLETLLPNIDAYLAKQYTAIGVHRSGGAGGGGGGTSQRHGQRQGQQAASLSSVLRSTISAGRMDRWLLQQRVVETLFGQALHLDLAAKSDSLLVYMAHRGVLREAHLAAMWAACRSARGHGAHEALVRVVHRLLLLLVPVLRPALRLAFFQQHVATLPASAYSEQVLRFIKDYTVQYLAAAGDEGRPSQLQPQQKQSQSQTQRTAASEGSEAVYGAQGYASTPSAASAAVAASGGRRGVVMIAPQREWLGFGLLWQFVQDTPHQHTSLQVPQQQGQGQPALRGVENAGGGEGAGAGGVKEQLVDLAVRLLVDLLRTEFREERELVMQRCLDCIQAGASVPVSLRILRRTLALYPVSHRGWGLGVLGGGGGGDGTLATSKTDTVGFQIERLIKNSQLLDILFTELDAYRRSMTQPPSRTTSGCNSPNPSAGQTTAVDQVSVPTGTGTLSKGPSPIPKGQFSGGSRSHPPSPVPSGLASRSNQAQAQQQQHLNDTRVQRNGQLSRVSHLRGVEERLAFLRFIITWSPVTLSETQTLILWGAFAEDAPTLETMEKLFLWLNALVNKESRLLGTLLSRLAQECDPTAAARDRPSRLALMSPTLPATALLAARDPAAAAAVGGLGAVAEESGGSGAASAKSHSHGIKGSVGESAGAESGASPGAGAVEEEDEALARAMEAARGAAEPFPTFDDQVLVRLFDGRILSWAHRADKVEVLSRPAVAVLVFKMVLFVNLTGPVRTLRADADGSWQRCGSALAGLPLLWRIALDSVDPGTSQAAVALLIELHHRTSSSSAASGTASGADGGSSGGSSNSDKSARQTSGDTVKSAFLRQCFQHMYIYIQSLRKGDPEAPSSGAAQDAPTIAAGVTGPTDQVPVPRRSPAPLINLATDSANRGSSESGKGRGGTEDEAAAGLWFSDEDALLSPSVLSTRVARLVVTLRLFVLRFYVAPVLLYRVKVFSGRDDGAIAFTAVLRGTDTVGTLRKRIAVHFKELPSSVLLLRSAGKGGGGKAASAGMSMLLGGVSAAQPEPIERDELTIQQLKFHAPDEAAVIAQKREQSTVAAQPTASGASGDRVPLKDLLTPDDLSKDLLAPLDPLLWMTCGFADATRTATEIATETQTGRLFQLPPFPSRSFIESRLDYTSETLNGGVNGNGAATGKRGHGSHVRAVQQVRNSLTPFFRRCPQYIDQLLEMLDGYLAAGAATSPGAAFPRVAAAAAVDASTGYREDPPSQLSERTDSAAGQPDLSMAVWDVLQSLPQHANLREQLWKMVLLAADRKRDAAPAEAQPSFSELLPASSPYRLLYNLQIIETFIAEESCATPPTTARSDGLKKGTDAVRGGSTGLDASADWPVLFFSAGGADHVLRLLDCMLAREGERAKQLSAVAVQYAGTVEADRRAWQKQRRAEHDMQGEEGMPRGDIYAMLIALLVRVLHRLLLLDPAYSQWQSASFTDADAVTTSRAGAENAAMSRGKGKDKKVREPSQGCDSGKPLSADSSHCKIGVGGVSALGRVPAGVVLSCVDPLVMAGRLLEGCLHVGQLASTTPRGGCAVSSLSGSAAVTSTALRCVVENVLPLALGLLTAADEGCIALEKQQFVNHLGRLFRSVCVDFPDARVRQAACRAIFEACANVFYHCAAPNVPQEGKRGRLRLLDLIYGEVLLCAHYPSEVDSRASRSAVAAMVAHTVASTILAPSTYPDLDPSQLRQGAQAGAGVGSTPGTGSGSSRPHGWRADRILAVRGEQLYSLIAAIEALRRCPYLVFPHIASRKTSVGGESSPNPHASTSPSSGVPSPSPDASPLAAHSKYSSSAVGLGAEVAVELEVEPVQLRVIEVGYVARFVCARLMVHASREQFHSLQPDGALLGLLRILLVLANGSEELRRLLGSLVLDAFSNTPATTAASSNAPRTLEGQQRQKQHPSGGMSLIRFLYERCLFPSSAVAAAQASAPSGASASEALPEYAGVQTVAAIGVDSDLQDEGEGEVVVGEARGGVGGSGGSSSSPPQGLAMAACQTVESRGAVYALLLRLCEDTESNYVQLAAVMAGADTDARCLHKECIGRLESISETSAGAACLGSSDVFGGEFNGLSRFGAALYAAHRSAKDATTTAIAAADPNTLNPLFTSWDYDPGQLLREQRAYVGLSNQGGTCYMNSFVQQLFHVPHLRRGLLSIGREGFADARTGGQKGVLGEDANSVLLFQLQVMFGYLQLSQKRYYDTLPFCRAFLDYDGEPVSLSEQKDINEFAGMLFDKLEHNAQARSLLQRTLQGTLVWRTQSLETPYRSEREESFYMITAEVKGKSCLEDSLELYVADELFSGDNKIEDSDSGRKVEALRRCAVRHLPPMLIVHLKRFEFDLETLARTKVNDRISFPVERPLDMFPYTEEGLALKEFKMRASSQQQASHPSDPEEEAVGTEVEDGLEECLQESIEDLVGHNTAADVAIDPADQVRNTPGGSDIHAGQTAGAAKSTQSASCAGGGPPRYGMGPGEIKPAAYYQYTLRGVVAHVGAIDRGHYYSFIKERSTSGESGQQQWLEFNDRTVLPFSVEAIPAECFGGVEERTDAQGHSVRRTRENNAYLLVYERCTEFDDTEHVKTEVDEADTKVTEAAEELSHAATCSDVRDVRDVPTRDNRAADTARPRLQSEDVLESSGERGASVLKLAPRVMQAVWAENTEFQRDRFLFSQVHFSFLWQLLQTRSLLALLADTNTDQLEGSIAANTANITNTAGTTNALSNAAAAVDLGGGASSTTATSVLAGEGVLETARRYALQDVALLALRFVVEVLSRARAHSCVHLFFERLEELILRDQAGLCAHAILCEVAADNALPPSLAGHISPASSHSLSPPHTPTTTAVLSSQGVETPLSAKGKGLQERQELERCCHPWLLQLLVYCPHVHTSKAFCRLLLTCARVARARQLPLYHCAACPSTSSSLEQSDGCGSNSGGVEVASLLRLSSTAGCSIAGLAHKLLLLAERTALDVTCRKEGYQLQCMALFQLARLGVEERVLLVHMGAIARLVCSVLSLNPMSSQVSASQLAYCIDLVSILVTTAAGVQSSGGGRGSDRSGSGGSAGRGESGVMLTSEDLQAFLNRIYLEQAIKVSAQATSSALQHVCAQLEFRESARVLEFLLERVVDCTASARGSSAGGAGGGGTHLAYRGFMRVLSDLLLGPLLPQVSSLQSILHTLASKAQRLSLRQGPNDAEFVYVCSKLLLRIGTSSRAGREVVGRARDLWRDLPQRFAQARRQPGPASAHAATAAAAGSGDLEARSGGEGSSKGSGLLSKVAANAQAFLLN